MESGLLGCRDRGRAVLRWIGTDSMTYKVGSKLESDLRPLGKQEGFEERRAMARKLVGRSILEVRYQHEELGP